MAIVCVFFFFLFLLWFWSFTYAFYTIECVANCCIFFLASAFSSFFVHWTFFPSFVVSCHTIYSVLFATFCFSIAFHSLAIVRAGVLFNVIKLHWIYIDRQYVAVYNPVCRTECTLWCTFYWYDKNMVKHIGPLYFTALFDLYWIQNVLHAYTTHTQPYGIFSSSFRSDRYFARF